jgi:hypothetical protein
VKNKYCSISGDGFSILWVWTISSTYSYACETVDLISSIKVKVDPTDSSGTCTVEVQQNQTGGKRADREGKVLQVQGRWDWK